MATSARAARKPMANPEPITTGLTFEAMRAAAEIYWPGLGGKVADQWQQWNDELFDGALRPVAMVLSRMSSLNGHWFPLIDGSANQRFGTEFARAGIDCDPPKALERVKRSDLLRGMMWRLHAQDDKPLLRTNCQAWCDLIMKLHQRLTGNRIWASPEYQEIEPAKDLGKGRYRPSKRYVCQDNDPETDAESLPMHVIEAWPASLMDLGEIAKDD